jgi:4-hydroxybenzoate-CoA ligase
VPDEVDDQRKRNADSCQSVFRQLNTMLYFIKVSGIWVSPFEVEAALATHPAILEAAVVPAQDDDGLLKPKAFVVLKDGVTDERLDERLKEHVKKLVGMSKYPRWIVVTDALPKTATGKIQRFKLREVAEYPDKSRWSA